MDNGSGGVLHIILTGRQYASGHDLPFELRSMELNAVARNDAIVMSQRASIHTRPSCQLDVIIRQPWFLEKAD